MTDFRTPRSRALGLGAAGHGVSHWIAERVSSVALIPLVLWGVFAALRLASSDYEMAVMWLASPINAVLLALLTVVSFMHMHSGMRVVVEDYIHRRLTKTGLLLLNLFVCALFGALALFSILKVALTGGAY
ncbi:MAG: succinate dehydrogenase, hydrophobic membrane anchor protein [Phenylobacterium sp.]|jgi:succinate dehydrogenase / fumarate reductase membrane anchor subunit|uniref:succinate dehydrogenase, hydrophobic membrane anchor protein n=1 Tax=Phenylobacterium sp. TaxID=1871053 RepID=UPI0025E85998|nr:succinate dehydrogenase, hydrophobic membrane anchor protein [Phenylobacterium sp.]MCG9915488.1 succinate dehydrogenase, hydrophobic membrane anchor protein [Phenylobacterium sp.]